MDIKKYIEGNPILRDVYEKKETLWINPHLGEGEVSLSMEDIIDAKERLERFAPLIFKLFPDTRESGGIIESPLREIPKMKENFKSVKGRFFLKMDSHLPISGSIKARGGVYEVLKYAEDLAIKEGIINHESDYSILIEEKNRDFFKKHTIQVGSTGNLGLSIGITSAQIGFKVKVHMSNDARQWKKDLLREKGVEVVEYREDYSMAVKKGRELSEGDPLSYFIDDENSKTLFLGYAVAALRLKEQFKEQGIKVDSEHPLFIYIPCGVGGAPGGVNFGIKEVFKASHVFFIEPVNSPCMLIGMATGLNSEISVKDFNLSGKTQADGLAVGRASGFVGEFIRPILSGISTIHDPKLFKYLKMLKESEDIEIEPSAAAAFMGPESLFNCPLGKEYIKNLNMDNSIHILWATGGNMVPRSEMDEFLNA